MVDLEIFQQSTGVVPIKNVLRPSDILYESWKGYTISTSRYFC